jgi:hypothetical protein
MTHVYNLDSRIHGNDIVSGVTKRIVIPSFFVIPATERQVFAGNAYREGRRESNINTKNYAILSSYYLQAARTFLFRVFL